MRRALLLFLILAALPAWGADDADLARLYQADQDDRRSFETSKPGGWDPREAIAVTKRDKERRARVTELLARGKAKTGIDYFHAAMVFQHGDQPADFLQAHILSTVAAFEGYNPARWLSAASLDRYLQRVGQPQVFGTQYRQAQGQPWTMDPYDRGVSDSVRQQYRVPSLMESLRRLELLRGGQPLPQSMPTK